jgi:hypothetical protein
MNLPPLPKPGLEAPWCGEPAAHCNAHMRAYGEDCRDAALEYAAKVCDELADQYRSLYKGRTKPIDQSRAYNPHTDGMSDGCNVCADAIRTMEIKHD